MKRGIVTLGVVAVFIGALLMINRNEPARVTEERRKAEAEAQRQMDEAAGKKTPKEVLKEKAAAAIKLGEEMAKANGTQVAAVSNPYQVEFECSNGTFIVEIHPEWAPIGADQFRKIIEAGIYNEARFFRVIPGFVVQWGIPGDPEKAAEWDKKNIMDEPVKTSNVRGTLTYAKSGAPNSRTTQMFINFGDNSNLDSMGFSPIGKVVKGMEVVDKINAEYREEPDQGELTAKGNAYLKEHFPKLDYIKSAKILGDVPKTAGVAESTAQASAAPAPQPAGTAQN